MRMRKLGTALGIAAGGLAAAIMSASPSLAAASPWQVASHPQPAGAVFSGFGSVFTASRSQAWAVGFQQGGGIGTVTPLIEHWNGASWAVAQGVPGVTNQALSAVGGSGPTDVWAGGQGVMEHFNGTSWTKVAFPAAAFPVSAISADSPADAWAAGGRGQPGLAPVIGHWDGAAWHQVEPPTPPTYSSSFTSIDALSPADVWVAGGGFDEFGNPVEFLDHWDGTQWQLTLNPVAGADTVAISGTSPTDVWMVGETTGVILHFNGTAWTQVPNPASGNGAGLAAVAALSPTDAWAMSANGTLTEHWDGTAWNVVPNASGLHLGQDSGIVDPASALSGIAGGPLFAVGGNDGDQSGILLQPQP